MRLRTTHEPNITYRPYTPISGIEARLLGTSHDINLNSPIEMQASVIINQRKLAPATKIAAFKKRFIKKCKRRRSAKRMCTTCAALFPVPRNEICVIVYGMGCQR